SGSGSGSGVTSRFQTWRMPLGQGSLWMLISPFSPSQRYRDSAAAGAARQDRHSSKIDARIAYSAGAAEVPPAGPTDSRTDAIRAMGISRGCPASLHRPRMSRTGVAGNDKDVSLQPEPRPDGASSAKLVDEVNRHEEPHSLRPLPGTHPQRR